MEEALPIARSLDNKMLICKTLNSIGEAHRAAGNMEAARIPYEEALALAQEQSYTVHIAAVSDNLARALISCGEPERAQNLAMQVLEISMATESKWTPLCIFDITTGLAALAEDWTLAARMRGAAEAHVENLRVSRDRADQAFLAPWTFRVREALGEEAYAAAYDSGHALSSKEAAAEALTWMRGRADTKTKS